METCGEVEGGEGREKEERGYWNGGEEERRGREKEERGGGQGKEESGMEGEGEGGREWKGEKERRTGEWRGREIRRGVGEEEIPTVICRILSRCH